MRVAVIGRGKTGSQVAKILLQDQIYDIYSSDNSVNKTSLSGADVAIVFVNHYVFNQIKDEIIAARIPIICGTTGVEWDQKIQDKIKQSEQPWIVASNFSLAMTLVKNCLSILGKIDSLIPEANFHIHEIHHTTKLDAPSGTALSWQSWLNTPHCQMTYERTEDVSGIHSLTVNTPNEEIIFTHNAHNRQLFAQGAIWAAKEIIAKSYPAGIHHFPEIVQQSLIGVHDHEFS